MNQIVAPKLQSVSKYPSVLRASVCDHAEGGKKQHNILHCYYAHYIDSRANKQAEKFVTPQKIMKLRGARRTERSKLFHT